MSVQLKFSGERNTTDAPPPLLDTQKALRECYLIILH